ncbi:MAG: CPBP family intramembrane glutamic endopeptidase [Terrimicrobiaceae bacterium]
MNTSILSMALSALVQLLLFTSIPALVYLIYHKGFLDYIGLRRPKASSVLLAFGFAAVFVGVTLLGNRFVPGVRETSEATETLAKVFGPDGFSFSALLTLSVMALVKTSLAEEILFRGFIGKRLMARFGFQWGNLLQSLIFGLAHLGYFYGMNYGISAQIFFSLYAFFAAWIIGWLNERFGNGSIVPGWVMHGTINFVVRLIR